MSDDEQKKDDERQLEFIRAYKEHKKRTLSLKDYIIRDIQEKVQISSVSGIFGFNLHCDVYFCVSAAISFHNERGITGR